MLLNESHETEKICIHLVIFSWIHDLNYANWFNKQICKNLINNSINNVIIKWSKFQKYTIWECVHTQKLINNDIKMALNSNKYFPHVQIFSNKQLFFILFIIK